MIKYWNPRRLQRVKDRKERKKADDAQREAARIERLKTYTEGDTHKNVRLMLDALGLPLRRKMIARLATMGVMSASKLADPFNIFLPSALKQVRILERSGLVGTRKQGKVRMCFLRPAAFRELSESVGSPDVQKKLH